MWIKTYSKVYEGVTKEKVWQLWSDVNNWPQWDKELKYCELNGEFSQGSQFILKPIHGPKVKITLSEVVTHQRFTDYTKFPGAIMYDTHELEETADGLRITNTIKVKGILSFLWIKLVAKNVAASIPQQTEALVNLARA